MTVALKYGHQVEDLSQRTETTAVYANPSGSWTSDVASEPVRVQTASGDWHDIDTTLVAREGLIAPKYAASNLVLADGGVRTFAAMTEDAHDLTWQWPNTLPTPTLQGSTATYANVLDGADLVVTATPTGFTHSIVLRDRPTEPISVTLPVGLDGASLTESPVTGALTVKSPDGDTVVSAPQPIMWDSTENAGGLSDNVQPVDVDVTKTGAGNTRLTLAPSQSYLDDPQTVYPVTIDPGYSPFTTGDTWIMNADFSGSQSTSQELRAGTYDAGGHIARALMKFDVSNLAGSVVTDATLRLRNWDSGSCTAGALRAYRVSENWSLTGVSWTAQPAVASTDYAEYSPAHGYGSGCPEDNSYFAGVASIVQKWADGTEANYGFRVRAVSETSNSTWRKYRSADYTANTLYAPRLITTYSVPPSKPQITVSSCPNCDPTFPVTSSLTPTLTTSSSDSDSTSLTYSWTVRDTGTGDLLYSATTTSAPSTPSSITIPTGKLQNGSGFNVAVTASDGVYGTAADLLEGGVNIPQPPLIPSGLTVSPCADPCTTTVVTSLTPILSGVVADPDGPIVDAQFELRKTDLTGATTTSPIQTVESSQAAYYTVPTGTLTDGGSYEFRLKATDGTDEWSSWSPFTVSLPGSVQAPTNLALTSCTSCTTWVSTSAEPSFTATNPSVNGARTLRFEVTNGTYKTGGEVTAGGGSAVTWAAPSSTLSDGSEWTVRVGTEYAGGVVWTATTPFMIAEGASGTSSYPAAEQDPTDLAPATVDPNAETDGPTVSTTQSTQDFNTGEAQIAADDDSSARRQVDPNTDPLRTVSRARQYAPIVYLHPDETLFPMNAGTFIDHSKLSWVHNECTHKVAATPISRSRLGSSTIPYTHGITNSHDSDASCSVSDDSSTRAKSTDNVAPFGGNSAFRDGDGMFMDLDNDYKDGQGFQHNEQMYYVQWNKDINGSDPGGERTYIVYWFHYGGSQVYKVNHEGDWERVGIEFKSATGTPIKMAFSQHGGGCTLPWGDVIRTTNGYHAIVESSLKAHASYAEGTKTGGVDQIAFGGDVWYPNYLVSAPDQAWYGYGGGWGARGHIFGLPDTDVTGPAGPSKYKTSASTFNKPSCQFT